MYFTKTACNCVYKNKLFKINASCKLHGKSHESICHSYIAVKRKMHNNSFTLHFFYFGQNITIIALTHTTCFCFSSFLSANIACVKNKFAYVCHSVALIILFFIHTLPLTQTCAISIAKR